MTEDQNPARLGEFNHSSIGFLPEYAAAAKALDDLIKAMQEKELFPLGQDEWLKVVRDMTAAIPFSDCCDCNSEIYISGVVPTGAKIERGWVTGVYICPECRKRWTCGWSLTVPNIQL